MKLLDYIFAARPLLLLPVWSIFLVSLHYHHELTVQLSPIANVAPKAFGWGDLLLLFGLTMLAVGAMYLNQVYDQKSDRLNDKLGWLSRGYLSPQNLTLAFLICSLLGVAAGILYPSVVPGVPYPFWIIWIFVQLFVLSYLYSAPPLRLKDRPILGLLANAYGFGTLVSFAVMPEITEHNSYFVGWDNPVYFFVVVGGVYLLTTIPDSDGDRAVGKKTFAVWLGPTTTKIAALILFGLGTWIAARRGYSELAISAGIAGLMSLVSLFVRHPRFVLAAAKLPIVFLTLLAGWFYPPYLVIVVVLIIASRAYFRARFGMIYPRLA